MTSYLGSFAYKSWKLDKIMPNSLKLLNHYILNNAPQKIRQWALKVPIARGNPGMAEKKKVKNLILKVSRQSSNVCAKNNR